MKNKQITAIEDGKKYWVTDRLVGCTMFLFRRTSAGIEICIVKRSSEVKDEPNRWCCPCGFIDGDESGEECACRELLEETGIRISPEKVSLVDVSTSPKEHKQHVCLRYAHLMTDMDIMLNPEFNPLDTKEISNVEWANIRDLGKYNLCFNHAEACFKIIEKILFIETGKDTRESRFLASRNYRRT